MDALLLWQQRHVLIILLFEDIKTSSLVHRLHEATETHGVTCCYGNLVTMATGYMNFIFSKLVLRSNHNLYVLFINRVCFSYIKILRPRSVRKDRSLNILQYEKETRLINSLLHGREMREGQPSLKSFCDFGLKLESSWVTHRQDDVDRNSFISSLGHLATNKTNRYTYQSCNCFLVFMTFLISFQIT